MSQLQSPNGTPDNAPLSSARLAQATLESLTSLSFRQENLQIYLDDIASKVSALTAMDWAVVTLNLGEQSKVVASSIELGVGADEPYPLHGTVAQTVVETGCSLTVSDTENDTRYGATPDGYRAYLGVPLQSPSGKLLGTICSFHSQPRTFDPEEVKCVELFAERATTAIDNFQLYQQQRKFNERLEQEVAARTAELRAAQAQLIEQARLAAIGEFTAMIVHEIRNPLTTIGMGLTALQSSDLSERDRKRLSLASAEENRLKQLLNEILQYAKPQVLERTLFSLHQLVAETVETLAEQPAIKTRRLTIDSAAAEIEIVGDRDKLKQVVINLISNACEAVGEQDEVSITLAKIPSDHGQSQACLQVKNGGEPIPPAVLAQLTKPFFSTKSSGNGLGLAIVKRILEAHRGTLDFSSSAEAGTLATVRLPIGTGPQSIPH
ncbi:MAG: ATP-binding protein [Cyanobacteria bacterium J06607_10]